MGVAMGFLAFLVIGGLSGACAWFFYPGYRGSRGSARKLLSTAIVGVVAATASSYLGQYMGFFQSGQMFEWLSAICIACAISCIYTALIK